MRNYEGEQHVPVRLYEELPGVDRSRLIMQEYRPATGNTGMHVDQQSKGEDVLGVEEEAPEVGSASEVGFAALDAMGIGVNIWSLQV